MAGSNLNYKKGDIIFKEGEAADGMYLVRKGSLEVFLHKDGNDVHLATVGLGGMIGEMAFFDKKPRSASVRAAEDCEATKITSDDFVKLMKQIPKWFVSIMSSLSTRLRDTNDRLQKVENKAAGAKAPFEDVLRILRVLNLLLKEATKEGKNWCLTRKTTEEQLVDIFALQPKYIKDLFDVLVEQKIFTITLDNYKNQVLSIPQKVTIEHLAKFIAEFIKANPSKTCCGENGVKLLECINQLAKESAYDTVTVTFEDAVTEGERQAFLTTSWKDDVSYFRMPNDIFNLTKVSNGIGFKVVKKDMPQYIRYHAVMVALTKAGITK